MNKPENTPHPNVKFWIKWRRKLAIKGDAYKIKNLSSQVKDFIHFKIVDLYTFLKVNSLLEIYVTGWEF